MTVAPTVPGLGWPIQPADRSAMSAHLGRRSSIGWPLGPMRTSAVTPVSETSEPHAVVPEIESEGGSPVDQVEAVDDPTAAPEARTAARLVGYAAAGSLADLDTPIAREAAAALLAIGRHRDPLPKPSHTRVMVVANQKGGVGKTTSTVNIAAALAVNGLRVLVIDLDPQGNASTALSIDHHAEIPSIYDVLVEERPIDDVVQKVQGFDLLWCVPATIDLAGAEIELVSLVARESRLRKAIDAHVGTDGARYDYVFIDCPPSLGLLTVNAMVGGDEVLIPIQCEYYALEGLSQLLKNIDMVRAHLNPTLAVSTILLTMYDGRTRLAAQVAEEVRHHFGETVLKTAIPRSVRISEAPSYGQTVMTYDPASSGALSYLEAARELAERGVGSIPENMEDES